VAGKFGVLATVPRHPGSLPGTGRGLNLALPQPLHKVRKGASFDMVPKVENLFFGGLILDFLVDLLLHSPLEGQAIEPLITLLAHAA
jgi:hypothetical protein